MPKSQCLNDPRVNEDSNMANIEILLEKDAVAHTHNSTYLQELPMELGVRMCKYFVMYSTIL